MLVVFDARVYSPVSQRLRVIGVGGVLSGGSVSVVCRCVGGVLSGGGVFVVVC